jgi:hypothetical protein
MDDLPDYKTWDHTVLAKHAATMHQHLQRQQEEIECLKLDSKTAIEAYRKLIKEQSK